MFWRSRKNGNFSYESAGAMLSPVEMSFYQVVNAAVGKSALLFCKVSMTMIIRPHHELGDSRWRKLHKGIESRYLDFVLVDSASLEPLCVLEFEDSSQIDEERQADRKFVHGVCEAASIPWVMIDARGGFAINDIRQKLAFLWSAESDGVVANDDQLALVSEQTMPETATEPALKETQGDADMWSLSCESESDHSVPLAVSMDMNDATEPAAVSEPQPVKPKVAAVAETVVDNQESNEPATTESASVPVKKCSKVAAQAPECPKCHAPLVRRQPKTGKLAGQTLWVCSSYPECRYLAPLKAHGVTRDEPEAVA